MPTLFLGSVVLEYTSTIIDKFPAQSVPPSQPPSDCMLVNSASNLQSDNTLSPGEANTIPLTPEMIELYERRVKNGYDVFTDLNYVAWLEKFHPEHLPQLGMLFAF